jgi:HEAT repeat protein
MDEKGTPKTIGAALPSDAQISAWSGEIAAAQAQANRRALPGWILLGLCGVFLCLGLTTLRGYAGMVLALVGVAGAGAVLLLALARRLRTRAVARLAGEIGQAYQSEGLSTEEAVEALSTRTKGKVSEAVLLAVDPGAVELIKIGDRGTMAFRLLATHKIPILQFNVVTAASSVTAVTLQGEHEIDQFTAIAADSLADKAYVEGIAALAMAGMIYSEVAPPVAEVLVRSGQTDPALVDAAIAAHRVFSRYDFKPEMAAVVETLARRRPPSVLEFLTQARRQRTEVGHATPGSPLDSTLLRTRGEGFVGACIDYIGQRTHEAYKQHKAWELLAHIPDARTLPHLMDACKTTFFFPQVIEGLGLLGEECHARLLEALQTGRGPLRFNAAMALGSLKVIGAQPALKALLTAGTSPVERAAVCYALARLGEIEHLATLAELLDDRDADVRQAASIALEHLNEPLGDNAYLRHLDDEIVPVRLSLTRKLSAQGTENPQLVEALIQRFEDDEEPVREAAVEAVGNLSSGLVYNRMVSLATGAYGHSQTCAYQVLGALGRPEAVPLLVDGLSKAQNKEGFRAVLSALGELGAAGAAGPIASYLDDKDKELSDAAFWALLRISQKDKEAGMQPLRGRRSHRVKLVFLEALHGDPHAKDKLAGMIRPRTEFLTLLEVLEYARILREPSFAAPLRGLLNYRNHPRFPGDRTVSYLAIKALVHTEMARQA